MIEKNTVFILGAGASVTYGYPTGFQLSQEIKVSLQNINTRLPEIQEGLLPMFNKLGYDIKELTEFYKCFLGAATDSVDKFLENRPDFEMLGKLLIAYFLKRKENSHQLFIGLQESNWYALLFNKLDITVDNIKNYNISFITFNYDRSLEFFLNSFLKNRTTKNSEFVFEVMECFPIVHVYGSLGNLPWKDANGIEYDYHVDHSQLKRMAGGIDIMSSERDSSQLKRAYELLFNASYIYFIGFGYDETNLRRLKIQDCMKDKTIKGTSVGIQESRRSEIFNFFDLGLRDIYKGTSGPCIRLADEKTDIIEFLNSYVFFQ